MRDNGRGHQTVAEFIGRVLGKHPGYIQASMLEHVDLRQMLKDKNFELLHARRGKSGDVLTSVSKRAEVFGKTPSEIRYGPRVTSVQCGGVVVRWA